MYVKRGGLWESAGMGEFGGGGCGRLGGGPIWACGCVSLALHVLASARFGVGTWSWK